MAKVVGIFGLEGLPLIRPGDDLARLIISAAKKNNVMIEDGDIVVVAQKAVSKSEGTIIELDGVKPSKKAQEIAKKTGKPPQLIEMILRESKRFLKASSEIVIVEDQRNIVNINAGIDKSNVKGANRYTLLPADPDKSARQLRTHIMTLTGKEVGVVISDTYSRAFRRGQVNFAIGVAGIDPFFDYRGTEDLFGYVIQVKFSAIADELASAAELVMGQGKEAIPVVIVKGMERISFDEVHSSKDLIIDEKDDLFRNVR